MKFKIMSLVAGLLILLFSVVQAEPSFNGTTSGCSGSGCHSHNSNDISAVPSENLSVQISLSGVQSGRKVAGELVDMNGNVVAVINSTSSNPFVLTAPAAGKYKVNAGYKNPSRRWDSTTVTIALTSVEKELPRQLITAYELSQNYPNPFNPSTKISYSIPHGNNVVLTVYNLLGEEVATLVNEYKESGNYSVEFNGAGLASGIYMYQLKAGNEVTLTKKMLLTR